MSKEKMQNDPRNFEVTFNAMTYGGEAMARLPDGRALFVPFVLPGERARVRLVEEKRSHARGRVVELLEASPERIAPRCAHFGVCGGCHYQHLPYAAQPALKAAIVREQLQRLGGVADPPVRETIADPRGWNYRNTAQFHLTAEGKVGYLQAETNQPFAIRECHLLEPGLDVLWPLLDLDAVSGLERVSLRLGDDDDAQVGLESSDPQAPELALDLPVSVVHLGPGGPIVMAGDDFVRITLLGRMFQVSAGAFFQVNTVQAGNMVNYLLANLDLNPQMIVMDLYCGVGLFSAFLAPKVGRLLGVEVSPEACDDFAQNLDEFDNVELYEGTAEAVLPKLKMRPDVVVVDPPRAGLERSALDALLKLAPEQLAYVSCDPSTLARDVKRLLAGGYYLVSVQPFDLFPQTYHVENVALLKKSDSQQ